MDSVSNRGKSYKSSSNLSRESKEHKVRQNHKSESNPSFTSNFQSREEKLQTDTYYAKKKVIDEIRKKSLIRGVASSESLFRSCDKTEKEIENNKSITSTNNE